VYLTKTKAGNTIVTVELVSVWILVNQKRFFCAFLAPFQHYRTVVIHFGGISETFAILIAVTWAKQKAKLFSNLSKPSPAAKLNTVAFEVILP